MNKFYFQSSLVVKVADNNVNSSVTQPVQQLNIVENRTKDIDDNDIVTSNNQNIVPKKVLDKEEILEIKNWASAPEPAVAIACSSRKELGKIKKKYGPHSVEYKTALDELGKTRKASLNGKKK